MSLTTEGLPHDREDIPMRSQKPSRTVYAVSAGSYSDYGVVCLCETKKLAKQVAAAVTRPYHEAFIEEFPLYSTMPEIYRWFARISPTGEVLSVESWDATLAREAKLMYGGRDASGNFYAMGLTREEAVKRASDFRAQEVAKEQGIG